MRTGIIAILLLSVLALTADARSRKSRKKSHRQTAASSSISVLKMRRSACFGRCPEYQISVYSTGKITYSGKRNAPKLGVYEKNVGAAASNLLARFAIMRIDTCSASYTKMIADLPGLTYEYTLNGKPGVVNNADAGPLWIRRMAESVDSLGKVDNSWKTISDKVME